MKRVVNAIKSRLKTLITTFKESAMNNFVATITDAILNVFISTTKNMFKIVRMLLKPLLKAVKILCSRNTGYSLNDRLLAASKIIGAALVGVVGVFLDEIINKEMMQIPFLAPIANYVSPVLSALIIGMASTLVLQGFDQYKKGKKLVELQTKEGLIIYRLEEISREKFYNQTECTRETILGMLDVFSGVLTLINQIELHIQEQTQHIKEAISKEKLSLACTEANIQGTEDILQQIKSLRDGIK